MYLEATDIQESRHTQDGAQDSTVQNIQQDSRLVGVYLGTALR